MKKNPGYIEMLGGMLSNAYRVDAMFGGSDRERSKRSRWF